MLKFLDEPDSGRNFLIIPVPYEKTPSFQRGTEEAPAQLLEVSSQLELFDAELGFEIFPSAGIATEQPLKVEASDPEEAIDELEKKIDRLLEENVFPIALGGEHTITLALARSLRKIHGPFSIIYMDGHLDLRDSYEGSAFSHACVARRLVEEGFEIFFLGSRCYCKEEWEFLSSSERTTLIKSLDELPERPLYYLSFDFDVIEPSVFGAASAPCPWGLSLHQVKDILKRAAGLKLVGADFVEFLPQPFAASAIIAADLIYKFIGWVHLSREGKK